ncbi:sugar phosphate isomerase/epimerase family protein [Arthrobacter woluwensis]|uniref:Sugar phosphate isomerase/epimerase n=1 Tax=Arthrobacter woluwensis TaxID=156980 RepID=A0A1H4JLM7_9MICC|nr:TIM barrel protein [Arthrobacter woluwensis]SEB46786.1 Sugar phosphate isomerase/epimerase [Arthrobacter woluwensis]
MPDHTLGLCSVTFRHLDVPGVLAAATDAGLAGIEWGSDVHCPDPAAAREVRRLTDAAGLRVLSLGSYFRADSHDDDFRPVLNTALALGAPRVRVWAGALGTDASDPAHRTRVTQGLRDAADAAADAGVELALEYHRNTLTDTLDSTLMLLDEVDRANVGVYWQPNVDQPTEDALHHLEALLPRLSGVHCFSWWPFDARLPLEAREDLWLGAAEVLRGAGRPVDVMFEFVPEDSPEALTRDAGWLRRAIGQD